MKRNSRNTLGVLKLGMSLICIAFAIQATGQAYEPYAPVSPARLKAAQLYNRLTAQKISIDSQILKDMEVQIANGNLMAAAHLATDQATFYTQTVRLLGSRLTNRPGSMRAPMSDLTATIIGFAKDDLDARQLLTTNNLYRFQNLPNLRVDVVADILKSNNHYADVDTYLETNPTADIRGNLVTARQQIADDNNAAVNHPDSAGILTSRAYLSDCANAGTNRRCYEKTVKLLTCHQLAEVASSSLPDDRIGKDVNRAPGNDPDSFQKTCKGCHSNMDAQRSAFAYTEFDNGQVKHGQVNGGGLFETNAARAGVATKMNKLGEGNFTAAYTVANDDWVNYAVTPEFAALYGWRDASGARISQPIYSRGLNAYGTMISRSEAFSNCMVQSVFENVCRRSPTAEEKTSVVRNIASVWEQPAQGNYKIRWLFEKVATSPACLGN